MTLSLPIQCRSTTIALPVSQSVPQRLECPADLYLKTRLCKGDFCNLRRSS